MQITTMYLAHIKSTVEYFCGINLFLLQAGLDQMAKGHMLADVVAIIGKIFYINTFSCKQQNSILFGKH